MQAMGLSHMDFLTPCALQKPTGSLRKGMWSGSGVGEAVITGNQLIVAGNKVFMFKLPTEKLFEAGVSKK